MAEVNYLEEEKEILKLKRLSKEENLRYGYEMGFIEKADYEIIKLTNKKTDESKKK